MGTNWRSNPATTPSGHLTPKCCWNVLWFGRRSSWDRQLLEGLQGMWAGAEHSQEESSFRHASDTEAVWRRAQGV